MVHTCNNVFLSLSLTLMAFYIYWGKICSFSARFKNNPHITLSIQCEISSLSYICHAYFCHAHITQGSRTCNFAILAFKYVLYIHYILSTPVLQVRSAEERTYLVVMMLGLINILIALRRGIIPLILTTSLISSLLALTRITVFFLLNLPFGYGWKMSMFFKLEKGRNREQKLGLFQPKLKDVAPIQERKKSCYTAKVFKNCVFRHSSISFWPFWLWLF